MSRVDFLKKHINTIVHSDNLEFMSNLPDGCIDVIFADPPYNMPPRVPTPDFRRSNRYYIGVVEQWDKIGNYYEYKTYCKKWLKEFKRIIKPNGSCWVMGSKHGFFTIGCLIQELGFKIINDVIWHKPNCKPLLYPDKLCPRHENLIWFCRDENSKFTFNYHILKELKLEEVGAYAPEGKKQLGTIWKIPICAGNERLRLKDGTRVHPTQKPEELMKVILTACSKEGDLVLDPFSGTGTTVAVAKQMKRRYIGVEQKIEYVEASLNRIKNINKASLI